MMLQKSEFSMKALVLIVLLSFANAARQNSFKINTDLTASVIDGGGGGNSDLNTDNADLNVSKITQSQNENDSFNINATDTHICTREETYVEQIQIPIIQPVRVRSSTWCLEFPPRCSNYKTEMRQVMQVKNVTKTRTIRFCCDNYEAATISLNDTVCKPICRGGCGRGHCERPDVCTCEAGYTGKHCTQRCDHDHWGLECKNECQCQNDAVCDNKSGLCHCTAGWIGSFCEQPCPPGTHGVMCRKACDCASKHCHPQTGVCENSPLNSTHIMIATLNSTIANITQNLDKLAKNIINITPATPTPTAIDTLLLPESTAVTTKTLPEVIVIKQDETPHTPKIIVHQQGSTAEILESLHNNVPKSSEVIHVITGGWPNITHDEKGLHLAGFGDKNNNETKTAIEHDSGVLSTLLIVLLIILIGVVVSFLYVYQRYRTQKERVEEALTSRNSLANGGAMVESGTVGELNAGSLGKSFLKPLPDLPAFTQMVRNKIEAHEYYDSPPSSNVSIHTPPYAYARKESLYSVVPPKTRRGSPDSHLYDEIRYTTEAANHHHHQQQYQHHLHQHQHRHQPYHTQQSQQQQHRLQHNMQTLSEEHSTYNIPKPISHHVTQLTIPPQNSNFLQVPPSTYTTRRVAHM